MSAKVGPFKSINEPQTVAVDDAVTVFVGMNEAGKTVFLQALDKSNDALGLSKFNPVDDYPRKELSSYLKQHETNPSEVTVLTYHLSSEEITELNSQFHAKLSSPFSFSVVHLYNNKILINIEINEKPVISELVSKSTLSSDIQKVLKKATSLREIPLLLKGSSLTEGDTAFMKTIEDRIGSAEKSWESVVKYEVWKWLEPRIPKFLYFSDYDLLPSQTNLTDLAQRVEQSKSDSRYLESKHRAVLALLRMADISISDFTKSGGYEPLKAKIEAVSINLTDQIMEFWKQNENLEVEIDIKPDPEDVAPYNNGPNLYLRIKNRRHRGVSTPFRQRSRGFIWFFSFLVWFDSVQYQIDRPGKVEQKNLILLLDEPGLALHALAQADFMQYIDKLAKKHQVLYTTHSPFMVHSDRL
ncbi:MAG: AAA family ATPase, partial [Candidatus Gastranaerophilales bacterium]|nr:AAA family ATPase [Candidatus Gastranaerophilales bacterium]